MNEDKKFTAGTIILQLVMIVVVIAYLVPIITTFNYAFKDSHDMFHTSPLELPTKLYFDNFKIAIKKIDFFQSFANTLFLTVSSVAVMIIVSSMAAFSIARRRKKVYKLSYLYFIVGILVPYQAIFVPLYLVGKSLGFVNSLPGVVFLYVATNLSFGVFLMTGFMKTIPVELEEAALIDGCSVLRTFWQIVMPLLKPAAATLTVLQSFMIWNDFLMPFLFLQKMKLKTLTVRQQMLFSQYVGEYSTAFAGILMSTIPIVILFLFMQKYFIKGITMGAVKG